MKTLLCAVLVTLSCGFAVGQQYKVLWSFAGGTNDGRFPLGNLVFDGEGNLYGTTQFGGSGVGSNGIVFELSPNGDDSWTEKILYNFCSNQCVDGSEPEAGLVIDSAGNLYGTTYAGGLPCPGFGGTCGTVFQLSPPSSPGGAWMETVLWTFCSSVVNDQCLDGNFPLSQLTLDTSGNLYGTTSWGGSGHLGDGRDAGLVFELSPGFVGWTETVLYNFCSLGRGNFCPDGSFPQAGVTFDNSGNLYGTTKQGGSSTFSGGGTVYKLSPGLDGWAETVLGTSDPPFGAGAVPLGTVTFDPLGNLYSTFSLFGAGAGGVFRLSPKGGGAEFMFDGIDGGTPSAGVLIDSKHAILYGTASGGGSGDAGAIFKIVAPAQETVLYNFCSQPNCTDGIGPVASLIEDKSSNLYGTTKLGGANNLGVVFEIVQSAPHQKPPQGPSVWQPILPSKD